MVFTNKLAVLLGVALAVVAAIISFLDLSGVWTAGLQGAVIILGAFGVQMLSPSQIAAKIPAHVAAIVSAVLTAANLFLQADVSMPTLAHALIGAAFAIAAALGITVTGIAMSNAVKALQPAKTARKRS
jgi:hypothetical protein